MRQTIKLLMLAAILTLCGPATQAQTKRSDDFKARYKLKEVVVMSRHNIRSPLTSGGAAYMRVTPNQWFKWSSPSSQLSVRGGVLETEMGQFFRKWVVDEGLLPDNYRPTGEEVLFYANSRQRTFATAKYFSAGFLPFANVEITHKLQEDKMDPMFTPQFTKMNDTYRQKVLAEMETLHGGPKASIGAALRFVFPETEDALEIHTPIGSKLVFEKWNDGTNDYVAVNLVYQSLSQLQNRTLLSLEVPPMVLPITIEGLTANSDGLYHLSDLDARMAETMAEYDAIEDATTEIFLP